MSDKTKPDKKKEKKFIYHSKEFDYIFFLPERIKINRVYKEKTVTLMMLIMWVLGFIAGFLVKLVFGVLFQ